MEQTSCGIPLLYGTDVVHGYRTAFPLPLAMACSWDPELLEQAQHVAAKEARADGVAWTFYPNADIARDARWGRVGETMGEDPYLASRLIAAEVKGFQGDDLSSEESIAACLKHFVGYGACVGGRDYEQVNLPESELRNTYYPSFSAGIRQGAESVMTAYMDLNNEPLTASRHQLKEVLRDEMGFDRLIVTDAGKFVQKTKSKVIKPRCILIYGRSDNWNDAQREAYRIHNAAYNQLSILTCDHLLMRAKTCWV